MREEKKTIIISAVSLLLGVILGIITVELNAPHHAEVKDAAISYVGDPNYKDGDSIERPVYSDHFSVMCYAGESCVVEVVTGETDTVFRFPYVAREWSKDNKVILMTLSQIESLPSFNGNPEWKCDNKKDCELVIEASKRIGW